MSILQIAGWITGVAAAAAVVVKILKSFQGVRKSIDTLKEGMQCLLRSDMTRTYYRHQGDKTMRQYEYENFTDNYQAYKILGGNSFIEKCKREIDADWEVRS